MAWPLFALGQAPSTDSTAGAQKGSGGPRVTGEGPLSPRSETWFDYLRKAAAVRTRAGLLASSFQFFTRLAAVFAEEISNSIIKSNIQRGVPPLVPYVYIGPLPKKK